MATRRRRIPDPTVKTTRLPLTPEINMIGALLIMLGAGKVEVPIEYLHMVKGVTIMQKNVISPIEVSVNLDTNNVC